LLNSFRTWALLVGALAVVLVLQFVGPARTNPRADGELALERQAPVPAHVAGLLQQACYDCHSHDTRWPWYSRVAPVSWLVVYDVDTARQHLNFSTWGAYHRFERADLLDRACDLAADGTMPLRRYTWLHPAARLGPTEVEALCGWTREESARLTQPPVP
jgi:hypothetical protein